MSSAQRSLLRFALALIGLLLSLFVVYAGIGWIVWAHPDWGLRWLSVERYNQLNNSYEHAMAAFFSADSDGDGASDGLEMYLRMDPRNPQEHPAYACRWPGTTLAVDARVIDSFLNRPHYEIEMATVSEWHRVTERLEFVNRDYSFPKGFQVRVRACPHWLLALPGGKSTEGNLLVPVGPNGTVTFGMIPTEQAASQPGNEPSFKIETFLTHEHVGTVFAQCLWPVPLPPQEPEIDEVLSKDRAADGTLGRFPGFRVYRVRWPSVTTRSEAVLIEAANAESGASWSPVALLPSTESVCDFVDVREYPMPVVRPWLRFRAVPVRYSGPVGSGH